MNSIYTEYVVVYKGPQDTDWTEEYVCIKLSVAKKLLKFCQKSKEFTLGTKFEIWKQDTVITKVV